MRKRDAGGWLGNKFISDVAIDDVAEDIIIANRTGNNCSRRGLSSSRGEEKAQIRVLTIHNLGHVRHGSSMASLRHDDDTTARRFVYSMELWQLNVI